MKISTLLRFSSGPIVFLASCLGTSIANAVEIEEVIVTAQKREETAKEVPIAIDVLSGKMMNQLGVKDTDDIQVLYPNLSTHNTSSANTGFTIRGVGTDNFHISGQQSVTTYIDDVALVSPFISSVGVFDVDRVEVLRGPQNTLYGRNTIGGAVIFNSVRPTIGGELNGKVNTRLGQDGEQDLELALGAPLSENWAFRVAGRSSQYDGHIVDELSGDKVGGYDRLGVRAMLAGDLFDNTNLLLSVYNGSATGDSSVNVQTGNFDAGGNSCTHDMDVDAILRSQQCTYQRVVKASELGQNTVLGELMQREPNRFVTVGGYTYVNLWTPEGKVFYHPDNGYKSDYKGMNLYLTQHFSGADLNSITSLSNSYFKGSNYRTLHGFSSHQEGDWNSFTQELRLTSDSDGRLRWITGLYYNSERSRQDTWVANALPPPGIVVPAVIIDSIYTNESAYAQLDYDLTERLSVTAGLRYTNDKLDGKWDKYTVLRRPSIDGVDELDRDYFIQNGAQATVAVPNPVQKLSESGWKLGLKYDLDIGMVYANVSTGFKGGAYDNRALSNGTEPVGPEFLDAAEIGMKSSFFDDKLQLNMAVFDYKWKDQQLFEVNPVDGSPAVLNISETALQGFEADILWAPSKNFYMQTGFGFLDAKVTNPGPEAIASNSAADKGDKIPNVPGQSFNTLMVYTIPLSHGHIDIQGTYRYAGHFYHDFVQELASSRVNSHHWLGANVSYSFGPEERYTLGLYGENLTGEYYCAELVTGLPSGNNWSCRVQDNSYGEATYGMSFDAHF